MISRDVRYHFTARIEYLDLQRLRKLYPTIRDHRFPSATTVTHKLAKTHASGKQSSGVRGV